MLRRASSQTALAQHRLRPRARLRRNLLTLAIESSCDDSCVAVLEKSDQYRKDQPLLQVYHHEKTTSNNLVHKGVHPLEALHSHQENLALLVSRALHHLPKAEWSEKLSSDVLHISDDNGTSRIVRKPDFVAVTRGPGMRSNLNTGLDLAKGLAVAWDRPLVGVNHMQAHALTPRLVAAVKTDAGTKPEFPFLSLLISGGHTMLLHSQSLTAHTLLASTADVAIGDAIDKIAREILPEEALAMSTSTMYGPTLEQFAFPRGQVDHGYVPPATRAAELGRYVSDAGWSLGPPMAASKAGSRANDLEFSFSGLCSSVKRIVEDVASLSDGTDDLRTELAIHAMRLSFEHLATRIRLALDRTPGIKTLVVSGGELTHLILFCVHLPWLVW